MKKPTFPLMAVRFPEANRNLTKPQNMTDEECGSLWVFTDGCQCVSCWKLTWRQRLNLLLHGTIWLGVLSGGTQPPVWMTAAETVFFRHDKG